MIQGLDRRRSTGWPGSERLARSLGGRGALQSHAEWMAISTQVSQATVCQGDAGYRVSSVIAVAAVGGEVTRRYGSPFFDQRF